jgi:hypothetical protein
VEDIEEALDLPFIQHRFNDFIPLVRLSHTQRKDLYTPREDICDVFTFNGKIIHFFSAVLHFSTPCISVFDAFGVLFYSRICLPGCEVF